MALNKRSHQPDPETRAPVLRDNLATVLTLVIVLACVPVSVLAATYYVDPVTGSNANNGTSAGTPWLNPPGTRKIDDSAFWSATWGRITTSNKIMCGDVVLLKGGSTQTGAQGGAWLVDSNYYTTGCTTTTRITLKVAANAEWTGASGHFTLDATSVVPAGPAVICDWPAVVTVVGIDFLQILGRGDSARFRVANGLTPHTYTVPTQCYAAGPYYPTGIAALHASGSSDQGLRLDWIDISNSYFGMQVGRFDNWQVSDITAENLQSGGLLTGLANDLPVNGGAYVNATVHDSGCGSSANPSCTLDSRGQADAFNFSGGVNMWCVNCTSHDNGERGASGGVVVDANMTSDWVLHWRNFTTYSNGATCNINSHWCEASGIHPSGNDWHNSAKLRSIIVGLIGWGNKMECQGGYGGAYTEAWNATCYDNGALAGEHGIFAEETGERLLNSITQEAAGTTAYEATTSNIAEPQGTYTPIALSNCYRPASSDSEAFGAIKNGWPAAVGTYTSPPAWLSDASNQIGLTHCKPQFTALSTSSFASNDFHLQAGSTAIDAGRFLMLANGAGTNATTITVTANGGSADPRYYFISPTSFLDAVADTIQIQNATCAAATPALQAGQAKIVGMTATTITLDRACSWTSGAGIHLPWAGSAPDIGAFEFGLVSPPTLMSAQTAP